ncbi:MAG: hypothetical protein ACLQGP_03040 [Isosphaeraceae bacterium]
MTTETLIETEDLETCDDCGQPCESTDGGMCESCSARHDAGRDAAQAESDEAHEDLDALESELADLRDRVADARKRARAADRELARYDR